MKTSHRIAKDSKEADELEALIPPPSGRIQWKGTDVCMDDEDEDYEEQ